MRETLENGNTLELLAVEQTQDGWKAFGRVIRPLVDGEEAHYVFLMEVNEKEERDGYDETIVSEFPHKAAEDAEDWHEILSSVVPGMVWSKEGNTLPPPSAEHHQMVEFCEELP